MSTTEDNVEFLTRIKTELDTNTRYNINFGVKRAYIFNHFMFNKGPNDNKAPEHRYGTEVDKRRIEACLIRRGFQIEFFQDAYKRKIQDTITNASKLGYFSCIVVIIMSHGDKKSIYARDMAYPTSSLFTPFMSKLCILHEVPKLFFIQACGGGKLEDSSLELDSSNTSLPYKITLSPNTLLVLSTAKEHMSWRNPSNGSWFIQSLCKHLEENEEIDIFHLLTLVHNYVTTEYTSSTDCPKTSNKKQMGHIESTLTKLLYL